MRTLLASNDPAAKIAVDLFASGLGVSGLGLQPDAAANTEGRQPISTGESRLAAWMIPMNEELMIARHALRRADRDYCRRALRYVGFTP